MLRPLIVLFVILLAACSGPQTPEPPVAPPQGETGPRSETRPVEGTGLLGNELVRPELDEAFSTKHEGLLAEAESRLAQAPDDVDALIWQGRRTAYLGRYGDAIEIYSRGLELEGLSPQDQARLLRHRGHRRLSLRQLKAAIEDFERAAALVDGLPDRVEQDGLPNARNQPTSTLGTNIWYHLGLARYLLRDFEGALEAYNACMELSKNPDMQVATAYWQYMTLARLGRTDEAAAVLGPITAELDIIENQAYHQLLLAYSGELKLDDLLQRTEAEGPASFATTGYGVGNGYFLAGDTDRAKAVWQKVVDSPSWASFGYIAAEAELAHGAAFVETQ